MKISNFVIHFERENLFFLYNTCTQSLFKINKLDYISIFNVIEKKTNIENLSNELLTFLETHQCLDTANNQLAHDFRVKMEYRKRFESFSSKTLSLVIAPTLACNFACPYCYESNLPISSMSQDVEDGIIHFIKSYDKVCDKIEVCWDGGEPLIGFDTIKSLFNKIETNTSLTVVNHIIVTNGYLLTEECAIFSVISI